VNLSEATVWGDSPPTDSHSEDRLAPDFRIGSPIFEVDALHLYLGTMSLFWSQRKFFLPGAVPALLILATFTSSCGGPSHWETRFDWAEVGLTGSPEQRDYPDDGAVILFDEGTLEVQGSSDLRVSMFHRRRAVKVFNSLGYTYAYVVIPYAEGSRVTSIEARTIAPDGRITLLDRKTIFDVNLAPNFVFFSDQRAKLFTLPGVEDGAVIDYRYSINYDGRTSLSSWIFQNEAPTLLSRFTLVEPSEWKPRYRVYHAVVDSHSIGAPAGFPSTRVWEARNIPKALHEVGGLPGAERLGRIVFSPMGFSSWQDVAMWFHHLAQERLRGGKRVRELAVRLTQGAKNDSVRLSRIFEWVRDHIRYVAVEIGLGGYQPHPAEEVCGNRYGDCKDMTALLCALSAEAGMEMRPALISTWQNGFPDTSLASPTLFNHVIAYAPQVGERPYWLDATEKGCPFGKLPWYDQELPVLVVDQQGKGKLLRTPGDSAQANAQRADWSVQLSDSGGARVRGCTVLVGALAMEGREEIASLSHPDRYRWLERRLAQHISGLQLDSLSMTGENPVKDSLILSYSFSTADFGSRREKSLAVKPFLVSSSNLPDLFRATVRVTPLRLQYGTLHSLQISLIGPPGWHAREGDWADSLASAFGEAHWSIRSAGDRLEVSSSLLTRKVDVAPEAYPEFRAFLDEVRQRDLREILFQAR
jgi:transglutaminase-like putative cysteine protease